MLQRNQTTGLLVRGIRASGSGGSEVSDHYYATNRGEFPNADTPCTPGGYAEDGDIVEGFRTTTVVDGPNPPDVVANTWRRQGLAAWLIGPTNLAFWDENFSANWGAPGIPVAANLQASGSDASDRTGRGFIAIMTAQDEARFRNVMVRRYVSPEPALALTAETQPPQLVLQKTLLTVFDPVNNTTNPKAIPGSRVAYTITATNNGAGSVDADSLVVSDPLPPDVVLFVGDLGAPGSGPVEFTDGSGATSSGLSFDYGGLADPTDDVEFSTNATDWSYVPAPDADGFDPAVRHIRIRPGGAFQGFSTTPPTRFDLRMRVRVR